ncbi:hypothetical protein F3Y22_tig00000340pilonHSYRG00562 [Hibiscus syriacus]|uniref:Pentatricopeptide repeat-containing protein n=1 Tax=Hibiscus syriacus TaxID=106335 RepID=A0A6A3D231_HIBSY|nr:hypothetical protein F3Y22_tig00000340pilonHSYRG00562 [Hibiscus syriacus]
MAISGSPDWSLASTDSFTSKPRKSVLFFAPCKKTLHFVPFPTSNLPLFHINSSCNSPSAITDHPSSSSSSSGNVPVTGLNGLLCGYYKTLQVKMSHMISTCKQREPRVHARETMLKLLIRYFVQSKKWDLIMSLSHDFKRYNVFPNGYTCSRLINTCVKARKFKVVEALLEAFRSDEELAVIAFNSAMAGQSLFLVDEFETRNLNSTPLAPRAYSILCDALAKSSRAYEALEYFRDMRKKGLFKRVSICHCDLRAAASAGLQTGTSNVCVDHKCLLSYRSQLESRNGVLGDAGQGFDKCVVAYSSMIAMYGKEGMIREAMKVLAKMKAKGCGEAMEGDETTEAAPIKSATQRSSVLTIDFLETSRIDELVRLLQDIKAEGTQLWKAVSFSCECPERCRIGEPS